MTSQRPWSFMYPTEPLYGSAATKVHRDAQDLEIVDRLIEPQTIASFVEFAVEGPLPNGRDCDLVRLTIDEVSMLQASPESDSDPKSIIDRVMRRIGCLTDGDRLCNVGKNIHSMKSRLWEGIIPMSDQRWREKKLDRKDYFDIACQHLSAVCVAFEYLNHPVVAKKMRDTFNLIWDHWQELEVMLNKQRVEKQQPLISVTRLWTVFMAAHFEVMTERAHRWVTVKVADLQGPLLHTIRTHRPIDLDTVDNIQWRATDGMHILTEITAIADYGFMISMDGYKGYTIPAIPANIPRALRSASMKERREAYVPRLKQLSRSAQYNSYMERRARGEEHHIADPASLYQTSLNQLNMVHQLRREVRGNPIEPIPREPWIMRLLDRIENAKCPIQHCSIAIYRLTYQENEAQWEAFKQKLEAHISDWGRGQTGSAAIKPHLKLQWLDGKAFDMSEGDIAAAKKHFRDTVRPSFGTTTDPASCRFFLAIDKPSVASYMDSSYKAATILCNDGDFAGFVLAVDADYNPAESVDRADESPGYHGQMRILGNLVWGELYAMHSAQNVLLVDLWPLALDHPNTVYVGPTVPLEIKAWRQQNGLRNISLRAVADYAHKKIYDTAFPVAPVQVLDGPAPASSTAMPPPNPLDPGELPDLEATPFSRTYMLRSFQRYLRRHNQYRTALMVDELLLAPAGQPLDTERLQRRIELAELDGPRSAPVLTEEEENEIEQREFERAFCPQQ